MSAPEWWPEFVAELLASPTFALNPYSRQLLERMTAELEGEALTITLPSPPLQLYVEQRLPQYWAGTVRWE